MYYITKIDDDGSIGFKVDGIHEILETDIEISDENYKRYFDEQTQGKQFIINDIHGDTFEEIFQEVKQTPPTPEMQIISLKAQLSETDYKIIKCYEYNLAGLELPYDIQELHKDRQDIRDKINQLETA